MLSRTQTVPADKGDHVPGYTSQGHREPVKLVTVKNMGGLGSTGSTPVFPEPVCWRPGGVHARHAARHVVRGQQPGRHLHPTAHTPQKVPLGFP